MINFKEIFTNKEKRTEIFPYIFGFFGVVSIFCYTTLLIGFSKIKDNPETIIEISPFKNTSISAKSAIVVDVTNGKILYEKNADEPLPLASLTKIMTTAVALETASGMQEVQITEKDLLKEGSYGFYPNSFWKFKDLMDYTLLVSANDGASAIASAVVAFGNDNQTSTSSNSSEKFVQNMNALAQMLELNQTKFFNEHGLDRDENHVGAYGSARDMSKLFEYILKKYPDSLEATKYPSLRFTDKNGFVYTGINTNISVNEIPSLIASKTGFTDLAGGNLIIAFDAGLNRPVIISVLGSTRESRFSDVLKLASTTLEYFKQKP